MLNNSYSAIGFHINSLDLEEGHDYLSFYDNTVTAANHLLTLTGHISDSDFVLNTHRLTLVLETDESGRDAGFDIDYAAGYVGIDQHTADGLRVYPNPVTDYVTIDSPHDSPLHQHAAVNVVSKECTGQYYADIKPEAVMERLMETAEGLTILTQGGGDMLYGRKGAALHRMKPFDVEVRSTLGAGDTFKAGCVYGLLHGMADDALVRFASACSAMAISRFPLPLHPPKLEEVRALIDMQKE